MAKTLINQLMFIVVMRATEKTCPEQCWGRPSRPLATSTPGSGKRTTAQRNWSCNHTTFWFNWWHSFIHWMFILMYTMFGFYLLTLVLYSGMTSTILRQLLVQQRQKVLRHHHLLPPLPCNCSSRPRKRSMKYTPRLELRIIYAHFLDSYVTRYLFIKGRWLCHIFIEVLERSTRKRHRGRHKGQRQSHRLLQKGRKCQP